MEFPFNQFFNDRSDPETIEVLTRGPLSPYLTRYAHRLHDEGYALQSGQLQLRMLAQFGRWLERRRLAAVEVDSSMVARFVRFRRKAGRLRKGDAAALDRLLRLLRCDSAPAPSSPTPIQSILEQFQRYLRQERGLSEATVTHYTPIVRAFLTERFPIDIPDFRQISASDIAGFVRHQAERITTQHATVVATALRSFLRHLLSRGAIDSDLAACVPAIATWSLSKTPKFLPANQIQLVLNSCNRNTDATTRF